VKDIFAESPAWLTIEKGFVARFDKHRVDGDLYRPRTLGPKSSTLVLATSGYTGIKNLYPRLLAQALTRRGYSVFALEFPGYGKSSGVASEVLISEQVKAVTAVGRALRKRGGWDSIVSMGWAMGAGVCLLAAQRVPTLFDGLVGLNGLYVSDRVQRLVRGQRAHESFLQKLQRLGEVEREVGLKCYVHSFFGYPLDAATEQVVDSVLRSQTGYDSPPVHLDFVRELLALDVRKNLAKLAGKPILWIHGRSNPIHPLKHVRELVAACPAGVSPQLRVLKAKHNDFMSFDHPVFKRMIKHAASWLQDLKAK
jgi:pimeloyl-ACP methyl ester carboxylesterase